MQIYQGIESYKPAREAIVTVGTFDGVHTGHAGIFQKMVSDAQAMELDTVVITFHPHPRLVIHPDSKNLKFINTQEKKYSLIARAGIQHLIIVPFTREFSNLSSAEFVRRYMVEKIRTRKLIVGYDHHFGKDRLGGFKDLIGLGTIHGFQVEEVGVKMIDGIAVSSTKIRNALMDGDVKLANLLLGYEYSITGRVIPGNRIGRTIGFPTANIQIQDEYKLISAVGVYACRVEWNGRLYKGMGNIGYRPTVDKGALTIEVHIFDFDQEIYNETITISFIERIRDEIRFENLSALRQQLVCDRAKVLEILNS
jgi:riboflavin kinase/FMN adenylyltransferase